MKKISVFAVCDNILEELKKCDNSVSVKDASIETLEAEIKRRKVKEKNRKIYDDLVAEKVVLLNRKDFIINQLIDIDKLISEIKLTLND